MSRYVIIGAGAVGATTAVSLHEAGRDVVLVARGAQLDRLRERGLDYVRPEGTRRVHLPLAGGPGDVELRADDVLVLATKSQDTEAALQAWAWQPVATGSSAAEQLPILLLQNGLENARSARRRFATVLDAVVLSAASHVSPGEVVSPSAPRVGAIFLGRVDGGSDALLTRVADDLGAAGYAVQVVDEIARWKAGKLLGNVGYNLDALYGATRLRDAAAAALRAEARAVLTAAGLAPLDPQADGALDLATMRPQPTAGAERNGSSTWQSLARAGSGPGAGRHETDFLNGEVVLLARLHGVTAPLNRAVQTRLARAVRERTPPGTLGDDDLRRTLPEIEPARERVLVDVHRLRDELAGTNPPLVLDVRWALGDPHGREHYLDGHVPGAVFADLDTELAAPPTPEQGRHPLPPVEHLQAAARRWGLTDGRPVVVYDNGGGLAAARAWWLLRWAGVDDVRILDGALGAWLAEGLDLDIGDAVVVAGDVTLSAGHLPVLSADETAALAREGIVLDARAAERYRGELEPVDQQAGHIPGARSAPTGDNLGPDGRFRPTEQLRDRFAAAGASVGSPVGVYCGSGVTAAHEIAALAVAGIDAALFPGSWSAWSADPDRPVAVGAAPAGAGDVLEPVGPRSPTTD